MFIELDYVTLAIDEELGEVPLDLGIGLGSTDELIERACGVSLDITLAEKREGGAIGASDEILDLLLGLGLLGAKLVAWVADDLQASATIRIVHFLVLAIVLVGQASLRGDVDDNDGFGTLCQGANGDIFGLGDLSHENIEKG